jgi:hypothetical protein
MKPSPQSIRHDGKTWTVGQTVRIPSLDYTGRIRSLWPANGTQPARAHVQRDGDHNIRAVTLDKLEVIP